MLPGDGINERGTFPGAQVSGLNFDFTGVEPEFDYPTPQSVSQSDNIADEQDPIASFQLPFHDLLIEMVNLFFDNLYHLFPCFHRKQFMKQLEEGSIQKESTLILFSMCCLAARVHPVAAVKRRQQEWYEQAKFSYQLTQRDPYPALRTIQAALLLIAHASTTGDFSCSWLFLGKVWRQAVALGISMYCFGTMLIFLLMQCLYISDRMDTSNAASMGIMPQHWNSGHEQVYGLDRKEGRNAVEKEEYRRTLWLLLIMDRNHAWPTGWPNALPISHFKVDVPIADSLFQEMTPELQDALCSNVVFVRNFDRLLSSLSSVTSSAINVFQYICIAYVLLGRVSEVVHTLQDEPDIPEYVQACEELDAQIVKFRLSLPRKATSVLEAPPEDRGHVVWLQIMLNNCAMLLYYRCVKCDFDRNTTDTFLHAVAAAQSVAQTVKDASRISIELLLSPHIASALYLAACILVIQWRTTNDSSFKHDVELFQLVFERMDETYIFLGLKFKIALQHDLKRSLESLEELRDRGARGMLADCTKWAHVKEEVLRRGLPIDIT